MCLIGKVRELDCLSTAAPSGLQCHVQRHFTVLLHYVDVISVTP